MRQRKNTQKCSGKRSQGMRDILIHEYLGMALVNMGGCKERHPDLRRKTSTISEGLK